MKKVVQDLTSGGIDWQREKWQSGLGSKFIHQGEKNAAKYADDVIVLSKGVQDYFKETYGRETHFIPNGVNRPQIREASLITDVFYVHPDEIEAITREFAAIGNNLNQIAAFFNSGGIQSRAMLENINHAISCIFEMREQVAEMAGKNYGNLKAYRK